MGWSRVIGEIQKYNLDFSNDMGILKWQKEGLVVTIRKRFVEGSIKVRCKIEKNGCVEVFDDDIEPSDDTIEKVKVYLRKQLEN